MRPKEKAIELIREFVNEIYPDSLLGHRVSEYNINLSKQCALLCVDKILKAEPVVYIRHFFNIFESSVQNKEYWYMVKEEIEKL